MFSQLKSLGDKLGESVREFEANLANPNSSAPHAPARPLINTSSSSRSPRPSFDNADARSSSPLVNSPSSGQSPSQLADQALVNLRASFRKGRASMDSSRSTSTDAVRKVSEDSVRQVEKAVEEEVAVVMAPAAKADEGGKESAAEAEATLDPVEVTEVVQKDEVPLDKASFEGVAEEGPPVELTEAAAPVEEAAPSPTPAEPPLNPLLRPTSPDIRFSISTAEQTPETTRVSTPAPDVAASPTPDTTSVPPTSPSPSETIAEGPIPAAIPPPTTSELPAADNVTPELPSSPPPAVVETPPLSPPTPGAKVEETPAIVGPDPVTPVEEAVVEPAVVAEPPPELSAPPTKDPRLAGMFSLNSRRSSY